MANIKSKTKNIKRIERNTAKNRSVKSSTKTAIKNAKSAILAKDPKAKDLIALANKEINTAVSKGVLHKNNGARKMERLAAFNAKASTQPSK